MAQNYNMPPLGMLPTQDINPVPMLGHPQVLVLGTVLGMVGAQQWDTAPPLTPSNHHQFNICHFKAGAMPSRGGQSTLWACA